MKALLPLLLVSLAANVALGTLLVRQKSTATTTAPATPASAPTPAATTHPTPAAPATAGSAAPTREPLWAGLPVDSFDEAITRLRAAGCPPREIAAVLRAMIQAWTMERRQALGFANENLPYWKGSTFFASPRPNDEMTKVWLEAQRLERTYLLTPELFGTDEAQLRNYRERFGALDLEKLRRLAVLESEFNEKNMQRMLASRSSQAGASAYSPDPQQQEQAQKEREAAIQAILSPEEYAAYEVRNGSVANSLRFRLENFRPTEAEYLALYAIEKRRRDATSGTTALTPQQRKEANDAYQAEIKAALGSERYADYEAVSRAGSDRLPALVHRLNLPLTTISAVNAVRDDTNVRAKTIRDNAALSAEQRAAQLAALAAEAETDLRTLFVTPRGLDAYKDIKGEWLRNLAKP
ncbi:hypothetical protein ESB00_18195 [Oleiharenicola lentus]|uniref:Lipase modulator n=1 Tax=Oleiharenicola lentus TaxID=2508720 RepID=A0A4Q1C5D8_9BACT|nr:hypothetical protein [Oleiharenicola lentus]RXK53621.1 hypothetical protein ESB00_18195 [Oleiharenicola lentus]